MKNIDIYLGQVLELGRDKNTWFYKTLERMLRSSYKYNISIKRPFRRTTKAELIKKSGLTKEFLDEYSYSCYKGTKEPCRECIGCAGRIEAYKELGWEEKSVKVKKQSVRDILKYASPIYLMDLDVMFKMLFKKVF